MSGREESRPDRKYRSTDGDRVRVWDWGGLNYVKRLRCTLLGPKEETPVSGGGGFLGPEVWTPV